MHLHQFWASRKFSRFMLCAALLLACFTFYIFWYFGEHLVTLSSIRQAQSHTAESQKTQTPLAIPKKLWYKLGPKGLNDETRTWTDGCIRNNPSYAVEFMTDSSADSWVRRTYNASHPELVDIFLGLRGLSSPAGSTMQPCADKIWMMPVPIWKADLLRYLLLFAEGGIYCDLDVSCEAPIDGWIPPQYEGKANLVVGWEFDVGWGESIFRQFTTWVIMARPGSPHVWMVVQDILDSFKSTMLENEVSVAGLTLQMGGDVVDATGPRRFTRGILKSMGQAFDTTLQDIQALKEPKLAGDVLVLPGYAFAASANTYDKEFTVPPPLAKHHYAGTWKNDKGGEGS